MDNSKFNEEASTLIAEDVSKSIRAANAVRDSINFFQGIAATQLSELAKLCETNPTGSPTLPPKKAMGFRCAAWLLGVFRSARVGLGVWLKGRK